MSHKKKPKLELHPIVFLGSATLIIIAVFTCLIFIHQGKTEVLNTFFSDLKTSMSNSVGWFFIFSVNLFLIGVLYIGCSKYGRMRIGGAGCKPEFSRPAWFAMLFSAGMGIGLVFWSVAEPMYHFANPPKAAAESALAAREAMMYTYFHWGLHAWSIYALVGLSIAYACFNHKQPMTIRSTLFPLLGNKIHGPIGNVIDIIAVVSTLFGVATSLGLGVQQINAGLNHLWGIGQNTSTQVVLIAGITAIATLSVVSGVHNGIKRLSALNMALAAILVLFVLCLGPTRFILDAWIQNFGDYIQNLPRLSTWTESYTNTKWQNGWTIFYWAWWIAWSPFVGMFIARISKGRTLREFITCVLLIPSLLGFFWLSVFGNAALFQELFAGGGILAAVQEDLSTAIFTLLAQFPYASVSSFVAMLVILFFFVTSSDSGSLVIDIITAGGNTNPPIPQRIFWAIMEGVVAAVLLVSGGLLALQTGAILTGLPFAAILLLMGWSLISQLRKDYK